MAITFLTVNVVCFWKTGISDSLLFYTRLLLYAVLSGLDSCCTCYVDRKLLDYVHHHNWHGPMAFFSKPFSLSLSFLEELSEYCLSLCSYPWKWCPGCTSNTFPGQSSLFLTCNIIPCPLNCWFFCTFLMHSVSLSSYPNILCQTRKD